MVSVVVVTHNRKSLLQGCLESIFAQRLQEGCEVIVVDNASTDGTEDYIRGLFKNRIKFVKNDAPMALESCKELGCRLASGDLVAFTDDDCFVAEDWLKNIEESLKIYDMLGGVVLPAQWVRFPWWWQRSLEWLLGINSNPGLHFLPLGSNVAFRKNLLKSLNDSKPKTFSSQDASPYGEDNERLKRALKAGFTLSIHKNMIVYHNIPPERLKLSYFLRRSYREGRDWARRDPRFSIFLSRIAALLTNPLRFLVTGDLNRFFRMIVSLGYMATYLTRTKQTP